MNKIIGTRLTMINTVVIDIVEIEKGNTKQKGKNSYILTFRCLVKHTLVGLPRGRPAKNPCLSGSLSQCFKTFYSKM